jgi:Na+/proline symporter
MSAITVSIGLVILLATIGSFLIKKTNWQEYTQGTTNEYINPIVAVLSIFASLNGGFMVLGLVQVGYEGGLTGYILGLAYIIGVFLLLFLMKKIKSNNIELSGIFGIDSVLLDKYGPNTLKAFYLFTGIAFAGVLGGQLVSISQYLNLHGDILNLIIVIGLGVIGTITYTILHGFKGVLKNDLIQSILELSVSFIFPIAVFIFIKEKAGTVNFSLQNEFSNIGGKYGLTYPIIGSLFLMLAFSTRADIWQRINLVNPKYQKKALIGSGVLLTFYYFLMTTAGILIKQNVSNFEITANQNLGGLTITLTEQIMSNISSMNWFNFLLQVFCFSGILIAILSSIDSYLNLTSISLTRAALWNSIPKIKMKDLNETETKTLLTNAKVTTIIVAIIAGVFAIIIPDIVDLMSASFSVIGVLIPIAIYGITSKTKLTDKTGAIPMWISLVVLIITLPILKKLAFIPAFLIGLIAFVICVYIDKKKKPSH